MHFAVFLVGFSVLTLELSLVRILDVALTCELSYLVTSLAILGIGLAGFASCIQPTASQKLKPPRSFQIELLGMSISIALIVPVLNAIPFAPDEVFQNPVKQFFWFLLIYVALITPFFCSGLFCIGIFSKHYKQVHSLYFADLMGAGVASIGVHSLVKSYGPGGLVLVASATSLVACSVMSPSKTKWKLVTLLGSLCLAVLPALHTAYFDVHPYANKIGILTALSRNKVSDTLWDPVSQIQVFEKLRPNRRYISYDGGRQSSIFYRFDGDLPKLRLNLESGATISDHFWGKYTLISHYLYGGTKAEVLILGAAGGAEIKAALLYGASHIDAVEVVEAVMNLAKGKYAAFLGNVPNHPNVHWHAAEARSFIRKSNRKYDVLQIHSAHTSSSISQGAGALSPVYLQTEEAFEQYFGAMKEDGLIHINHHLYPRVISTAAAAWSRRGGTDFRAHVVVIDDTQGSPLPTILIKMRPWKPGEVKRVEDFFASEFAGDSTKYKVVVNPVHPERNEIDASVLFNPTAIKNDRFELSATTDNRPFFNFTRRTFTPVTEDDARWLSLGGVQFLKDSSKGFVPLDIIHLALTAVVTVLVGIVFLVFPSLLLPASARPRLASAGPAILYFACLGSGFMILQNAITQKVILILGSPALALTTTLTTMLLFAGVGSFLSSRLTDFVRNSVFLLFLFLALLVPATWAALDYLIELSANWQKSIAVLSVAVCIAPLCLALGMPFPIGMAKIGTQERLVAWCWSANGVFSVVGGLFCALVGAFWGLQFTVSSAALLYLLAGCLYIQLREIPQRISEEVSLDSQFITGKLGTPRV